MGAAADNGSAVEDQPFGERLQARMAALEISQSELARRSDVSIGYVSRLVHGQIRNPTLEVVRKLATALEHEPWIGLIVATYHTKDELTATADLYDELIELEPVHVDVLDEAAARRLIQRPVGDFELDYADEAVERLLHLSGRHPLFLQRLCFDLVEMKNTQPAPERYFVSLADGDAGLSVSLERLTVVFAEMTRNQVGAEWQALLTRLACRGERGLLMNDEALPTGSLERLLRRELIEAFEGGYRFKIELLRAWFAAGRDRRFPPTRAPSLSK
jgi:transcriptional regulator with XRE-family HTH domain